MTTQASRRQFLRTASALSVAGAATPFALNLASNAAASAQTVLQQPSRALSLPRGTSLLLVLMQGSISRLFRGLMSAITVNSI